MKRRRFFKNMGLSVLASSLGPTSWAKAPTYRPPYVRKGFLSLADATNDQGEVAIRIVLRGKGAEATTTNLNLQLKGPGLLNRKQAYFLEPADYFLPQEPKSKHQLPPGDEDILVLWLSEATEASILALTYEGETQAIPLSELVSQPEVSWEKETWLLTVNLLGHREIGQLNPEELGIPDQDSFRFAILADPQGGDPKEPGNKAPTRIRVHNAYIADCVALANELEPDFALVLGDFTDSQGETRNFQAMEQLFEPLQAPLLLAIGNHETAYRSTFGPGYDMSAFDRYFASQQRINGTELLLYSFNLGRWHFVVWPDPLRKNFWQTHPHYFDWLARDLAAHQDRPVIFLHHVPLHPIGIDPLLAYVETPAVRRTLLDILATHGDVRYAFSGHVHIPTKASLKTAVEMRGIRMINLPAAGYRPRAFGEPDFFGGPEQGVCLVEVKGEEVQVHIHTVTREQYTYPDRFPAFDEQKYPLWLQDAWALPLEDQLENGDFSDGLTHWHPRFIYTETEAPSHGCEVRTFQNGQSALHLFARSRDYKAPGQDRMPQTLNRVCQAVKVGRKLPGVALRYRLSAPNFSPDSYNGAYLWLALYRGSESVAHLVYSAGGMYYNIASQFGQPQGAPVMHFDLPATPDEWHEVLLSPSVDFQQTDSSQQSLKSRKADRMVVHLGVWTINDGYQQEVGVDVSWVRLDKDPKQPSPPKRQEQFWARGIDHIAGEHRYARQDEIYPPETFQFPSTH